MIMETVRVDATCYYPQPVTALVLPGGGRTKIRIGLAGKSSATFWVDDAELKSAKIEASAIVDLRESGVDADLGLGYWGGRWRWRLGAPYGVGTRSNPLWPGITFACGWPGYTPLPYGTRLDVESIPSALEGKICQSLYLGDCFGPHPRGMDKHRVDLFTATPCQWRGKFDGVFRRPWRGVSAKAVLGAQQALNIVGAVDDQGNVLVEDNGFGPLTAQAMTNWLSLPAMSEPEEGEARRWVNPRNHVLYWWIRETGRRVSEGGDD